MPEPIDDPLLEATALGPDVEPDPNELAKGSGKVPATGGPEVGEPAIESRPRRLVSFLQILGPGLITGASDDDPSGIGTYSQVGSQFGFGMLWTALFTFPLMVAMQELCSRIALQTGVGLGTSLRRRFPVPLVGACILALALANTLNLGADLGAVAAGGSILSGDRIPPIYLVVPVAVAVLFLQLFATYQTIFRIFKWLTLVLFAYVLAGVLSRPPLLEVLRYTFIPHIELSAAFVTGLVAVLGTTISPYLFFWQASSEVDKMRAAGLRSEKERRGVEPKGLRAARVDIITGMLFAQVVTYFIILTSATVLHAHGKTGIQTASQAAQALTPFAGRFASVLFAFGLIGTGLLAIPVLSGSAAYAIREFGGFRGDLSAKPRYRPTFYAVIALATVAGLAMNLVRIDIIKALFVSAVINGVVAVPLMVLVILLGSDRMVMKEHVSRPFGRAVTWVAAAVMGVAAVAMIATMLSPVLPRL